jgi:DNA-binding response OmpR family regulator
MLTKPIIAIVEDDRSIRDGLVEACRHHGFDGRAGSSEGMRLRKDDG